MNSGISIHLSIQYINATSPKNQQTKKESELGM